MAKAWAAHSIPNLLGDLDVNTTPVQLVPHCSIPDAKAIPDGSMEVLQRAISEKGEGGNAVELDLSGLPESPMLCTTSQGIGRWSLKGMGSAHAQVYSMGHGRPRIYRKICSHKFSRRPPLLHWMWKLLSLNSAVTIFLDGHNEDAAKLVALVSNHPAYLLDYVLAHTSSRHVISIVPSIHPFFLASVIT